MKINVKKGLSEYFRQGYEVDLRNKNKASIKISRYMALQNKKEYSLLERFYYKISQLSLSLFGKSDYQTAYKLIKQDFKDNASNKIEKLESSDAEKYAKLTLKAMAILNILECENANKSDEEMEGIVRGNEVLKKFYATLPAYLINSSSRLSSDNNR